MATLQDVAKKANVSKMTVSRTINHPETVSDEVKELVRQAMTELNYTPNIAARALTQNKTQIIKVCVLEELTEAEPHYVYFLIGISKQLEKYNYSLQLVTTKSIHIGNCDGYIIAGARQNDLSWIEKLTKPVVFFGENKADFPFVDSDNYEGSCIATEYAVKRGYEHIVFVGIDLDEPFEISREQGYLSVMQQYNMPTQIIRLTNHSHVAQDYICTNWRKFSKNTVFICSSDRIALGIERGIKKYSGNIPFDYGVIGHDGVFLDKIASPKLTTIQQDLGLAGKECVELLMKKLLQPENSLNPTIIKPRLVIQESTK